MDASPLYDALNQPPPGYGPMPEAIPPPGTTGFPPGPASLSPRLGAGAGATVEAPSLGSTSVTGGISPLVDAIIHHESGGNPKAIGKKGEVGLMQIEPQTAAAYGATPQQLLDPEINRQIGTRYLTDLMNRYKGNRYLALMAYNEGPGRVDKGQFLPQSVQYANAVLARSRQGDGQQQPQQQPSLLGRLGGAVSSLLGEGTAYAQEMPPGMDTPPPGYGPMATGSTAEVPTVAPSPPPTADPTASAAPAPPGYGSDPATPPPAISRRPPSSSGMAIPPPGAGGFPPGFKLNLRTPFGSVGLGSEITTAEASKEEGLYRMGQQVLTLSNEMQQLYNEVLKPKLESGEIHSFGEGLIMVEPEIARKMGYTVDPAVRQWNTKAGQLSSALNSYYSALAGARGGVSYAQEITFPHAPHAVSGWGELTGLHSPTGTQYSLEAQGEALPDIIHKVRTDMGMEGPQTFHAYVPQGWTRMPSGKLYDPSEGRIYDPKTGEMSPP